MLISQSIGHVHAIILKLIKSLKYDEQSVCTLHAQNAIGNQRKKWVHRELHEQQRRLQNLCADYNTGRKNWEEFLHGVGHCIQTCDVAPWSHLASICHFMSLHTPLNHCKNAYLCGPTLSWTSGHFVFYLLTHLGMSPTPLCLLFLSLLPLPFRVISPILSSLLPMYFSFWCWKRFQLL